MATSFGQFAARATVRPWRSAIGIAPGFALAAGLAAVAWALSRVIPMPTVLIGLALGVAVAPVTPVTAAAGLGFSGRTLMRCGITLLGAQITLGQIIALGWQPILIAVGGLVLTLALGFTLARWLGLERNGAVLTAASVAICGASAAMAVSAILPRDAGGRGAAGRSLAATVAAITLIGSLAMVVYPIPAALLGFDATEAGILYGTTLHEVVQAVGAGFAHSEMAGETAATVKLVRVACLAPVMLGLAWYFRRGAKASRDGVPASAEAMPPLVPSFLIGFVVLALMASLGLIPGPVAAVAREAARFLLLVAIVALGLRISPRNFLSMDCKLIVAIFCQSLLLALFTFTIVWARGP